MFKELIMFSKWKGGGARIWRRIYGKRIFRDRDIIFGDRNGLYRITTVSTAVVHGPIGTIVIHRRHGWSTERFGTTIKSFIFVQERGTRLQSCANAPCNILAVKRLAGLDPNSITQRLSYAVD